MLQRLGLALATLFLARVLFYLFNRHLFAHLDFVELITVLIAGLRFDLSAVGMSNGLFIILSLFPWPAIYSRLGKKLLFAVFILGNGVALLAECVDIIYFRFTLKRSTGDVLSLLTLGGDVPALLPRFIVDYWYVCFIWLALLVLLGWAYRRVAEPVRPRRLAATFYPVQTAGLLLAAAMTVFAIRGGWQLRPINLLTAGQMVGSKNIPLAINTTFSILRTLHRDYLNERSYFDEEHLNEIYPTRRDYTDADRLFNRKNVVVIIMESWGKEFIGPPYGEKGLTPFFDSLILQGLFFSRAFANGKKSMEAIPAIIAGIPTLMFDPYITSVYAANQIESLASLLGARGWRTAFFHGGRTGTMGFDAFCRVAGFQKYYGREDYPHPDADDGSWGIFDEPFFEYFADKLKDTPRPFFAAFLSLSSHHPYTIPEKYRERFPEGAHPLHKTVRYADFALREFFAASAAEPWYDSTLFVITADHTLHAQSPFFRSRVGTYAIPLLYYCPGDSLLRGLSSQTTQQIDIMPTVLDYLNYPEPFFSFGHSVLDTAVTGFAINYLDGLYQLISGDFALHFDGVESVGLFEFSTDSTQSHDLRDRRPVLRRRMEDDCRAVIQVYNRVLIRNRMTMGNSE